MLTPEQRAAQLQAEMERTFSPEDIASAAEQMHKDLEVTVRTLALYVKVAREEGDITRAAYFMLTYRDMMFLYEKAHDRLVLHEERLEDVEPQ